MLITNDEESKNACGLRKALFQEIQVFLYYLSLHPPSKVC